MTLAVLDANGWAIIIGAVSIGVAQVVSMILSYLRDRDKVARDALAAKEVKAVKDTLQASTVASNDKLEEVKAALVDTAAVSEQKLDIIAAVGEAVQKTGQATHVLVNNVHGKALESNAIMARRLAELTGAPADHAIAEAAAKLYAEHQDKQAAVDRGDTHV